MSRLAAVAVLLCGSFAFAESREEEAKKYAGQLKSKDAKVRLQAVIELGKLGQIQRKLAAPYVPDLIGRLKDSEPRVRAEAAKAVARVDVEDKAAAVKEIAALLKDEKSMPAREGQATALGEIGATAEEESTKQAALAALREARKKTDDKREQKIIQAALVLIVGKKKK